MPTHVSEMFFYDEIYFENGRKDPKGHPVIIAGRDETNVYAFAMTSKTKHTDKYGYSRNIYNQNIKYVKTKPGRNCQTNNSIEGLINTTNCITIPIEKARTYEKFGQASPKLIADIVLRWAYQQNEICDKKDDTYSTKAQALGISDSVIMTPLYRQLVQLMSEHQAELDNQRTYAKELREYREACTRIRRENVHNHYVGLQPKKYPPEPHLPYDRVYFENYASPPPMTEEERLQNSPFAGLSEQLFGPATKKEEKEIEVLEEITEKKAQLIELKNMLQGSQEQSDEQEVHHGRRAA